MKVSVVKCEDYIQDNVDNAVKKAMCLADFEVKPNSTVLLKVNCLRDSEENSTITTNPAVIRSVCKILKEKKCRIWIGDSGGEGLAEKTQKGLDNLIVKTGIKKEFNVKLINFDNEKKVLVKNPDGKQIKEITTVEPIKKADFIISLPKLKTHAMTKYTGAVKNSFGCIPLKMKSAYHAVGITEKKFSELLVDIFQVLKPNFFVMDGIIGMEGNGPSVGSPKKAGIILASKNGVCLDFTASGIIGFKKDDILMLNEAKKRGLYEDFEILGEKNLKIPFKQPDSIIRKALDLRKYVDPLLYKQAKPNVNFKKCIGCGTCARICPMNAITMIDKKPNIDDEKCIKCFCCQEVCPESAIKIKKSARIPWLIELVKKAKKRYYVKKL